MAALLEGGHFPFDQVNGVFGRHTMPIYISRGRFTSDAVKGMVAKPENREEVQTLRECRRQARRVVLDLRPS
jgi:hypothetical protein